AAESVLLEVPAGNAEAAVRLVLETFLSPRFDPPDLAKEKTLLSGTLATERDDPKTLLDDAFFRTLFPSHSLARLASLTDAEVKLVSIEDVRAFHRTRLDPARLALIVVGHCSALRIETIGREILGAPPPPPARRVASFGPLVSPPPTLSADVHRRVSHRTTSPPSSSACRRREFPIASAPRTRCCATYSPASTRGSTTRSARSAVTRTGSG